MGRRLIRGKSEDLQNMLLFTAFADMVVENGKSSIQAPCVGIRKLECEFKGILYYS